MAFNLTRALCSRNLNVAYKYNNFFNPARSVSMRIAAVQPQSNESHDDKNERLKRPQSPHLTIYKMQLTSVLSITHRFTGIALTGYAAILGLSALALPDGANSVVTAIDSLQLSAPSLIAAKFIIAFPAAYHTVNGVRHLIWDMGKCLTIKEVYTTGYTMLLTSTILTAILAML